METVDVQSVFLAALDRLEVGWTRTSSVDFQNALAEIVIPPAVGVPLPFDGVSLEGLGVVLDPTPSELDAAQTGITATRLAIADYGTLVIQSAPDHTEAVSLYPALHVAVLRASDIVPSMKAAFQHIGPILRANPTTAILATGPSATADMGALVRGAHGPQRVHVMILEDR